MILTPTLHAPIPMESKVKFREDAGLKELSGRTGRVVGIAFKHVIFAYVVLMDGPPIEVDGENHRAVCMLGSLLTVL